MHLYDDIDKAATDFFHVEHLLHWQRVAVANTISGRRQIVILPTGYGKSLCFLVPAVMLSGATLIIYPLLSLMSDQKRRMDESSLPAVILKGGQTKKEREEAFSALKTGVAKVVIANPEVLQVPSVLRRLRSCNISHIAVDEAHCVSEWGKTFRPAYTKLGGIITALQVQRVTALTATASQPVLLHIQSLLFGTSAVEIVRGSLDRPNLHYRVLYAEAKQKALLKTVLTAKRPCVVFCGTRANSEDSARMLAAFFRSQPQEKQVPVKFYHAGMTKPEKKAVEQWFFTSTDGILCCTSAYGMGVDKPDIRTCIHIECPETIEFFIQEAGRIGRDRKKAESILIWSHADNKRHPALKPYATSRTCRRQFLLDFLDGEKTVCSGCDICNQAEVSPGSSQQATDSEIVLRWIQKHRRLYREEDALQPLTDAMNRTESIFPDNVWEINDIRTILKRLKDEHSVRLSGGKLDIVRKKTPLIQPHLQRLHWQHRLRRLLRRLARAQERLQQSF